MHDVLDLDDHEDPIPARYTEQRCVLDKMMARRQGDYMMMTLFRYASGMTVTAPLSTAFLLLTFVPTAPPSSRLLLRLLFSSSPPSSSPSSVPPSLSFQLAILGRPLSAETPPHPPIDRLFADPLLPSP